MSAQSPPLTHHNPSTDGKGLMGEPLSLEGGKSAPPTLPKPRRNTGTPIDRPKPLPRSIRPTPVLATQTATTTSQHPLPVPRASQRYSQLPNHTSSTTTREAVVPEEQSSMKPTLQDIGQEPEELTLQELVEKHSKFFPLRIRILEGYCGPTAQYTISNSDEYNVHFMKRQKVVTIRDSQHALYSIPLNSSVQFAIVYDPQNQNGEEVKPQTFKTAGDIMSLKVLPKVVSATKVFKGSNEHCSVQENEILIVHQVQTSQAHGKKSLKKTLEVFSLHTRSQKFLPNECEGHFSTNPQLIRLYLPHIIRHVPGVFPTRAVLYRRDSSKSSLQYFPSGLRSNLVTMVEAKMEMSLIASSVMRTETSRESRDAPLLDIPVDDTLSTVKLCLIEDDPQETEKLYDYTRDVFKTLDLAKLVSCKDTGSEETNAAQVQFYTSPREGSEREGIELHAPAAVYHYIDTPATHPPAQATTGSSTSEIYETLEDAPPSESQHTPEPVSQGTMPAATYAETSEYYETLPSETPPPLPPGKPKPLPATVSRGQGSSDITEMYESLHGEATLPPPPTEFQRQQYNHEQKHDSSDPQGFETYSQLDHHLGRPSIQPRKARTLPRVRPLPPIPTTHTQLADAELLEYYDTFQSPSQPPLPTVPQPRPRLRSHNLPVQKEELSNGSQTLGTVVEELKATIKDLTQRVEALEKQQKALPLSHNINLPPKDDSVAKENRAFLCSLSVAQVQNLLQAMELQQYSDKFATECISGEILADLDEDILQHELGVNSKIHRIRLMKVITGKHSTQNILAGMDPYGTLEGH